MKTQRRGRQVNQRRFVADLALAKEFGCADMSAAAMRFDPSPVIDALQNVLAIFSHFQFNDYQTPILPERQQIDRPGPCRPTMSGAELRVQWRYDRSRIQARDITAQDRLQPSLATGAI